MSSINILSQSIYNFPSPTAFPNHKQPKPNKNTLSFSTQSTSSSKSNDSSLNQPQLDINSPISKYPSFKSFNPNILNSIYKQIIQEENDSSSYHLKPFCTTTHLTIQELHRAILIDWLVNIHLYLRLSDECFFLTVKVIDQYISQVECLHKDKLQLLGITALLISSKYIENNHPSLDELCLLCDNAYTKIQIVSFEKEILIKLDYTIVQDNIVNFFDIMCLFFDFTLKEYYFGKFLLEISILDLSLLIKYKKTLLVLSIIYLVMKMNIDKHPNYKKCFMFLKNRKVTEPQVKQCGKAVLTLLENVKKCSLYTSSLQKYNLKIGNDYCCMNID